VFVAASNDCFHDLSFEDCVEKLVDLEFSSIDLTLNDHGNHITASEVADDVEKAITRCTSTRRLNIAGYNLIIDKTGDEYLNVFEACCKLAKATKVVTLTVESGEHGTPFNEEVERFKRSKAGHLSADPDTVSVICGHVKGLGLSLDPSHYIFGQERESNYEKLLEYIQAVYLRDSTKDQLQVRVGQGVIDYGKLINLLQKQGYDRALVVDIQRQEDVDHMGEMRKMRLLLESLLLI